MPETRPRATLRRLAVPAAAALVALAVLLRLGFWQLDRLAWKTDLIARVEERVALPPVAAPEPSDWPSLEPDAVDYRRVAVTGRFAPGELYYYIALGNARGPYQGPGYFVYSPFMTDAGWAVMVNRGFVPDALRDPSTRAAGGTEGETQTVTGLLRVGERPNVFTPAPDPAKGIWFAREPEKMAAALGVAGMPVAPFSIDADAAFTPPSGLPQAGETVVRFKNDHLGYALTWFGLALTLVGVFAAYARSVLKAAGK
ncbi:SURF1 family protein [Polymorphum gilvum]|uniref:SURF1 family protein n=1 Tax=Polymorphum gilvum TaxID=991904 RepID=UPI001F55C19D|nr:SURF1 family protein [Polymorphum gilvum]